MDLSLQPPKGATRIEAYAPGMLRISGREFSRSVCLTSENILEDWPGADQRPALDEQAARQLQKLDADLILIGTGAEQRFPPREFLRTFRSAGVGCEVMTTPAACRTFNVLVAEERSVAALLLIDQPSG